MAQLLRGKKMKLLVLAGLCAMLCALSLPARAVSPETIQPVIGCEDLAKADLSKVADTPAVVSSAKIVTTGKGHYCRVTGHVAPNVGFEVDLPAEHWAQRFLQVGCGGLCGNVNVQVANAGGCVPALSGDLVVASDDMGHTGSMMDASWAADP